MIQLIQYLSLVSNELLFHQLIFTKKKNTNGVILIKVLTCKGVYFIIPLNITVSKIPSI